MHRKRCTAHSSFCSSRRAPTSRVKDASFGKMPTTSVRRLISLSSLDRIGGVQLGPVRCREGHVSEHVRLDLVQEGRHFRQLGPQLIAHLAPLGLGRRSIVLGNRGGDEGPDHAPSALAGMGLVARRSNAQTSGKSLSLQVKRGDNLSNSSGNSCVFGIPKLMKVIH